MRALARIVQVRGTPQRSVPLRPDLSLELRTRPSATSRRVASEGSPSGCGSAGASGVTSSPGAPGASVASTARDSPERLRCSTLSRAAAMTSSARCRWRTSPFAPLATVQRRIMTQRGDALLRYRRRATLRFPLVFFSTSWPRRLLPGGFLGFPRRPLAASAVASSRSLLHQLPALADALLRLALHLGVRHLVQEPLRLRLKLLAGSPEALPRAASLRKV